MVAAVCLLIIALLLYLLWVIVPRVRGYNAAQLDRSSAPASGHRLLTPRTPAAPTPPPTVRPWREHKTRRGASRRIPTDGFA